MVTWADLEEAEREYNAAAAEFRRYNSTPQQWHAAHEELTNKRRVLVLDSNAHFEHTETLANRVEHKRQRLAFLRQAWVNAS